MREKANIAAFFDFDGTLFEAHFWQGQVWQGAVKHHIKHRVKLLSVSTYLATHIPLWLAGKLKILSEETYKVRWGEDLATLFKGFNKEEGLRIFDWIGSNYIMKSLRPDIMALLQSHRREKHIVVLLSGSFTDFLETIKQRLGIDYIIGTKLEVINNIYSGKIIKPLCIGVNKARMLKEFIREAPLDIELGLSFAYSDSILDAPVLEMVGNPVAVYPDKKLANLAQCRGWQILPP